MPEPTLTPKDRVRRVADVLDAEIDDQTVMMDIEKGSYFGLNQTGSGIWAMLAEPVIVGELCERLVEQFDVPREQCERQVIDFLGSLLDRGLLQVVSDDSG
jgi:hypothetical protein